MKTALKTTIAILVLTSMGVGTATLAAASQTEASTSNTKTTELTPSQHSCEGKFHHQHSMWRLGFKHDKHLSVDDAKVITKAALLMHGKHNLDVGKITAKMGHHGQTVFVVQIVNKKKNEIVKTVILNSRNGHIRPCSALQCGAST